MAQFDDVFADLVPPAPPRAPGRFTPQAQLEREGLGGLMEAAPSNPFDDAFADLIPGPDPRDAREAELDLAGTLFGADPGEVERSWGEARDDSALAVRRGARNLVGGLLSVPVGLANLLVESPAQRALNAGLDAAGLGRVPNILEAFGGAQAIAQPEFVRGMQESLQAQNDEDTRERQSDKARAQAAALAQEDGFADSLGWLLANPSAAAMLGAEQVPQLAVGVPGSLPATLAAQVLGAAGQNEAGTAQALADRVARGEITQAEADRLAADLFAGSLALNAGVTALPGARVLERIAANRAAQVPAGQSLAHVFGGALGEGAQGAIGEAGDQILSNIAAGQPWSEGAGQAAALGLLLEGPIGAAGSAAEVFAGRAAPPAVVPQPAAQAAPPPVAPPMVPEAAAPAAARAAGPAPAAVPTPAANDAGPMAELDALLTRNLARAEATPAADPTLAQAAGGEPSAGAGSARPEPAPAPTVSAPPAAEADADGPIIERDFSRPRRRAVKTARNGKPMDLLQVVAHYGLDRDSWLKEGIDPAEFKTRVGIHPLFRKRDKKAPDVAKGMTPSDLREFLQQEGYLTADPENGVATVGDDDAVDLFMQAFRGGRKIFAPDQQQDVARWQEAEAAAEAEYEAEMRRRVAPDDFDAMMADAEARAELADIDTLVDQAYQLGATDEDIVATAFDAESHEHRAELLRALIEDLNREADQRAVEGGAAGVDGEASRDPFEDDDLPGWNVQQQRAGYGQPGLFGNPTAREEVDAARRRRDDIRNGRTGAGRTDMLAGAGELFAGRRPDQADVEGDPWRVEQPAYHGTPHAVDRFSLDRVGTGEGQQAYGWGMYFASRREVADWYRQGLSTRDFIEKARDAYDEFADPDEAVEALRAEGISPAQAELLDALQEDGWLGFDYPHQAIRAALRTPEDFDLSPRTRAALEQLGNVYKVEVPEDSELLDWDKPIDQQPAHVQAAVEAILATDALDPDTRTEWEAKKARTGGAFYKLLALSFNLDGQKGASELLQQHGIPGLRYLDGLSRTDAARGSHNYVIWDEAAIGDPLKVGERRGNAAGSSRDMFVTTRGDRTAGDATARNRSPDPGSDREPADTGAAAAAARRGDGGRGPAPDSRGTGGDLQHRPDYTPELGRRAQYAVDELVRRFGGTVLGDSIARDFRDVGTAQLLGKKVETDRDLAALAEVYRNPIFETLRYVFVDDDGNVVGESAVTSRLASAAMAFPVEENGPQWVKDTAARFGANGVWLIHNHPSGDPNPSRADVALTARLAKELSKGKDWVALRGHVVLNHTVYSYIDAVGIVKANKPIRRPDLKDPLVDVRGVIVGRQIDSPATAASLGAELFNGQPRDKVAVMVLGVRQTVRLAATLPVEVLKTARGAALLSMIAKRSGGVSIILVADKGVVVRDWRAFNRAGELGLALDVIEVDKDGRTRSLMASAVGPGSFSGRYLDDRPTGRANARSRSPAGLQVYEGAAQTDTAAFRRWFGDSKVVDDNGEPLVVYHGTRWDFDSFVGDHGGAGWFTPNASYAQFFAENDALGGRARVIDAYLAISNPLEIPVDLNTKITAKAAQDVVRNVGLNPEDYRADINLWEVTRSEEFVSAAERMGHDGLMAVEGGNPSWLAFRPEQIKSATANAGTFDPTNPSIVREERPAYTDSQREFMRKAGLQDAVDPPTTMERLRRWAREAGPDLHPDNLLQSTFDRFHAIKLAVEQKGNIAPENDPYLAARLINTSSTMEAILRFGAPKLENGVLKVDREVPGLLEALGPVAKDMPQFLGWMVARRAEALKRMGREHLMTDQDIRAGLSLAAGREKEFAAAATAYLKLKNAILDLAEQSGTIDPAARAAWDHAEYIPFYRQMSPEGEEATAAPGTKEGVKRISAGIKELKGGKSALEDPLGNIIKNFVRLVDSAMKNRAMTLAVDQIGAPYFVKAHVQMKQELIPLEQVRKHLNESGVDPAIVDAMPDAALEGVRKMMAIKAPEGPDILRIMRDGKAEYYHVMDPLLLRSMDAFAEAPTHWFVKMLGLAKNLLTAGATSTPDFIIRNWIRDTGEAAITAPDKYAPVLDSVRGAVDSLRESEFAQDLMMAGAYFHSGLFRQGDVADTAKAIRRALRASGLSQSAVERYMRSIVNPVKWWDQYRRLAESTEMGSRIALARRRLEAGAGDVLATFEAKDFLDFQMRGDSAFVQFFIKVVPFLNARLQGMYRLGRVSTGKGRRGKVASKLAVLATVSMALAWWNSVMYGEAYDELEEWDKDANWHIAPGTPYHMRIPKPFELGLVGGTMPERMFQAMRYVLTGGEEGDRPEQGWDAFWHAITSTLAINPLPQAVKPAVEAYTNYNMFFGTPIESKGDQYRPTSERFSATSTSKVSRYLSKGIEKLLGDENTISPKKLDHLWRGYTGGMGMYLLGAADWLIDQAEGAPVRPAKALRDFPVLGTVARGDNEPRSTRYVSEFYELDATADFRSAAVKAALEDGDEARAKRLEAEWGWLLGERVKSKRAKGGFMHEGVRELNKLSREMAASRKDDQRIYADRKMTAKEKREALDRNAAARNAMAKKLVRQIRERERNWHKRRQG